MQHSSATRDPSPCSTIHPSGVGYELVTVGLAGRGCVGRGEYLGDPASGPGSLSLRACARVLLVPAAPLDR